MTTNAPLQSASFNGVAGLFGIGFGALASSRSNWIDLLVNNTGSPSLPVFGLDFGYDFPQSSSGVPTLYANNPTSALYLGGINERYRNLIDIAEYPDGLTQVSQMGNGGPAPPIGSYLPPDDPGLGDDGYNSNGLYGRYHSMRVWGLSVCGYELAGQRVWDAMIDTGASCLGLPAEMFDSFAARIALICPQVSSGIGASSTVCYLHPDLDPQQLPTLSFRLHETGKTFYIPLQTLLLAAGKFGAANLGQNGRRVCISRLGSMAAFTPISFGALTLRSLYLHLDLNTKVVGVAQKLPTPFLTPISITTNATTAVSGSVYQYEPSYVQCLPLQSQKCAGMQVFYASLNLCLDPPCSDYYFFTFNSETKRCELGVGFHGLAVAAIVFFFGSEFALYEWFRKLTTRAVRDVPLSQ